MYQTLIFPSLLQKYNVFYPQSTTQTPLLLRKWELPLLEIVSACKHVDAQLFEMYIVLVFIMSPESRRWPIAIGLSLCDMHHSLIFISTSIMKICNEK